ncbi:DsbA family protein [Vibrio splendidus]|uniref:DsbA family protein n=1 Tax=Vibrio splendidus TaxID=29497 RepID=UPI0011B657DD|nr:DsbA family protein [Vibrio splendidus]UOE89797.1 DsbA family protein [Vibrio splendidus]
MVKIHYVYDPLCGWCYGASPVIKLLLRADGVEALLHPGGLFFNKKVEPSLREHILIADKRIQTLTNIEFGEPYKKRVETDENFILDSYRAIQAIHAFEHLGRDPLTMLFAIQTAHYVKGLNVSDNYTIEAIAAEHNVLPQDWHNSMSQCKSNVRESILVTQQLINHHRLTGYPSILMEKQGQFTHVDLNKYHQNPMNILSLIR